MKDKSHIAHLLRLYYDGETTREQEQTLHEYFTGEASEQEFMADKAVFNAITTPITAPCELKQVITAEIQRRNKVKRFLLCGRTVWRAISSVAAIALIALTTHLLSHQPAEPELTPEEIHQHALSALSLLTSTVGQGYSSMQMGLESTAETFETANNALEKL